MRIKALKLNRVTRKLLIPSKNGIPVKPIQAGPYKATLFAENGIIKVKALSICSLESIRKQ